MQADISDRYWLEWCLQSHELHITMKIGIRQNEVTTKL